MAASKEATLLALAASAYSNGRTIVFFRTKVAAHRAKLLFGLEKLPPAAELHGNMSQTGRLEALDAFRKVMPHQDSHLPGCHVLGVPVGCSSSWILPDTQLLNVQLLHRRERPRSCWRQTWPPVGWTSRAWRMSSTTMRRPQWCAAYRQQACGWPALHTLIWTSRQSVLLTMCLQ